MIDKVKLFNDFLRLHPDIYGDMRMWYRRGETRSGEFSPGVITPELAAEGMFVFLGKRRLITEVNNDVVLDDMDRLLPVYKYIESKGRVQPLPTVGRKEFVLRSGRISELTATKASYAQRELDVSLRHNLLQRALERQLAGKYGPENVFREVDTGIGVGIDVVVRRRDGNWYYEIKTFKSPRECIREAIGQLLEYAFWPGSQEACQLIIVGESAPDRDVVDYCRRLKQRFSLPIEYEQIVLEGG